MVSDSIAHSTEQAGCGDTSRDPGQRKKPLAFTLYQFLPPDDVVSAIHMGELCAGLVSHGWEVEAFPCVWACRDDSVRFAPSDDIAGVKMHRIWRPRFRQSSSVGRILNALWMIGAWSVLAFRPGAKPDVLIVGTDPVLSILVAIVWSVVRPRTRIAHWCFDVYPEAAIAEGILEKDGIAVRILRRFLRPAYRACSLIADLGPCMRERLRRYPSEARRVTLVPWALEEPASPMAVDVNHREGIFGHTKLALLYSGTFGLAHSYGEMLDLAEALSPDGIRLGFSVGGNRASELRQEVERRRLDLPFVPFAKASELSARLASADVHVVTLRREWTGMVVPSKFFGALSVGRPVLFAGDSSSALAKWIAEYGVGWTLNQGNVAEIRKALLEYANSPEQQARMRSHCYSVYREQFSRASQIAQWNCLLRSLVCAS